MAVYQDKAKERIKSGLRKHINLVAKATDGKWQEADTRKIVLKTLVELLGWDEFENITGEYAIKGTYADYAIQKGGRVLAVVEIKQIGLKLNDNHIRQATNYAINEGVEWVFLTNGDAWNVYRIVFENKIPDAKSVFSISIADPDLKPAEKAEKLYLMSEEAFRKEELAAHYDRHVALSGENLALCILSEPVLNAIRVQIKNNTGHKVANSELATLILERVVRDGAPSAKCEGALKKLAKKDGSKPAKDTTKDTA
jgi:predicted type IV restriction endonuclease